MGLAALTLYCSEADVVAVLGALGEQALLDDDGDGVVSTAERAALTMALGDAACTINEYCYSKYTPQMLATSNWVNIRAAWLAAYALCEHRGLPCPDSIAEKCERYMEGLEAVSDGRRLVPGDSGGGLPLRLNLAPLWSNVRADPSYQFKVLRVERRQSSQQPTQLPRQVDYPSEWTYEG